MYHNCYLEAPDGETLCTCDRKKAEWYVTKNLGVKVKDNPLTVRLNFEPSGRAMGEVGEYYTQTKVNQCVVCGAEDEFVKKNVVPKEYRKNFPGNFFFNFLRHKKPEDGRENPNGCRLWVNAIYLFLFIFSDYESTSITRLFATLPKMPRNQYQTRFNNERKIG